MRIRRLDLEKYGRFTGESVEFPGGETDFHIVFGPNEAGKSTVMAALGDLLFGMPNNTPYNFLHGNRDMRVGAVLEKDGETLALRRRKGRRDTLLGPDDAAAPGAEAGLRAFLAGVDRPFFERMFSLNHGRLREGGAALLDAGDDAAGAILDAGAGMKDARACAARLAGDADALWGKRLRKRAFHAADERLRESNAALRESTLSSDEWNRLKTEREKAEKECEEINALMEERNKAVNRLSRIRRVLPDARAKRELDRELEELGDAVLLPEDAGARMEKFERDREKDQARIGELGKRLDQRRDELGALGYDGALIERAEEIKELDEARVRAASEESDLRDRRTELASAERKLSDRLGELGWASAGAGGRGDAGAAPDAARLQSIIDAARKRGDIDSRIRQAEKRLRAAEDREARLLAGLHPRMDDSAALRAAAPPAREDVRRHRERELAQRERRLAAPPPTAGKAFRTPALARGARLALAVVLLAGAYFLAAGPLGLPIGPGPAVDAARAYALPGLLILSAAIGLLGWRARTRADPAREDGPEEEGERLAAEWARMWRDAPFEPLTAETMLEWLDARERTLDAAEERAAAANELEAARGEERAVRDQLIGEMEAQGFEAAGLERGDLNVAIISAERHCREHQERMRGIEDMRRKIRELRTERIGPIEKSIAAFGCRAEEFVGAHAADLAGLSPDAAVREMKVRLDAALDARKSHEDKKNDMDDLAEQINEMESERDERDADIKGLMRTAGAGDPAALKGLIERSDRRRARERRREELVEKLRRSGDGLPLEELEAECAGIDPDAAMADAESAEAEIKELRARRDEAVERRAEARRVFEEAGGAGGGAARAAADREAARAELRGIARRYVKTRASAILLNWCIERYRAAHQAPMLQRAGGLFGALTGGSFERLQVAYDDNDSGNIEGTRPDGGRVPVSGMSDGSADQLFLALRIAAVEEHLERGAALPFVADDLFINFDDERAAAGLGLLAELGGRTQVLFFTHHRHLVDIAKETLGGRVNVARALPGAPAAPSPSRGAAGGNRRGSAV